MSYKDVCFDTDSNEYNFRDGEKAYNAYADAVEWKSFSGEPLKQFSELPVKIRNAWCKVYKYCYQD